MKRIFLFTCVFLLSSLLFGINPTEANTTNQLIVINKSINKLAFFSDGKLVRTFSVATGRTQTLTPEGTFRIVNKIKNRPYYTLNIPGGDPRNPLGDRWLGLEARGTYGTTYGIHGNSNEASIGTYASSGCVRMHNNEIRWLFDRVANYTPVVITRSNSSFEEIALANGYSSMPELKSIKLGLPSPQVEFTPIQITANAVGGNDKLYKFSLYDGEKWVTLGNYYPRTSLTWRPYKPGDYKIQVTVKNKNSTKEYDDIRTINYKVVEQVNLDAIGFDKASPQKVFEPITLTAKSSGGVKNLYRFSLHDGEKWVVLGNYYPRTQLTWRPYKPGNYTVRVEARDVHSTKEYDSIKTIDYTVTSDPVTLENFNTDISSPQTIFSPITLSASAKGGASVLYKFNLFDGEKWVTLGNYYSRKDLTWRPFKAGEYQIQVLAKDKYSNNEYDDVRTLDFTVTAPPPVTLDGIHTDLSSPQAVGSKIKITANSSGGTSRLHSFLLYDGEAWVKLGNYYPRTTLTWRPYKAGEYQLKVITKDINSSEEFDDYKVIDFTVN